MYIFFVIFVHVCSFCIYMYKYIYTYIYVYTYTRRSLILVHVQGPSERLCPLRQQPPFHQRSVASLAIIHEMTALCCAKQWSCCSVICLCLILELMRSHRCPSWSMAQAWGLSPSKESLKDNNNIYIYISCQCIFFF